jgi:hypothetical protein
MYGGALATLPAYLADVFGTRYVSAVHGRLLTASSAAGVLGPVLVNYIRQSQIDHGIARDQAYSVSMYIMSGLLVLAFFANLAIKPVSERFLDHSDERPPGTGTGAPAAIGRGRGPAPAMT